MARNRVQFQKGYSLTQFMGLCCKNRTELVNCQRWLERGVAA